MKLSQVRAGFRTRRPHDSLRGVRDHAVRAGTANPGEGLAIGLRIRTARSADGRVIAGVLFTCSRTDSGRDRDVSARGERGRYVMPSRRAPSVIATSTLLSPLRPLM